MRCDVGIQHGELIITRIRGIVVEWRVETEVVVKGIWGRSLVQATMDLGAVTEIALDMARGTRGSVRVEPVLSSGCIAKTAGVVARRASGRGGLQCVLASGGRAGRTVMARRTPSGSRLQAARRPGAVVEVVVVVAMVVARVAVRGAKLEMGAVLGLRGSVATKGGSYISGHTAGVCGGGVWAEGVPFSISHEARTRTAIASAGI